MSVAVAAPPRNSPARVLFASLVGTTIEFFDFYIYATAAVLVFPRLFFPGGDPASATLQSFATFAIAFFARPFGAALFGHFGDRIGRKATLVAALMTMGLSTVAIGLLPTYEQAGLLAPLLLCLFRIGQGLGLGGEWGGAVLLATENAPPGREAWYGMFPQLGAPIGFLCSTGSFLILTDVLTDAQFDAFGWRIPFVASAVLVLVGLWVRLSIAETPAFTRAIEREERVRLPLAVVFRDHAGTLALGTLAAAATFMIFYLMTVFTLSWGTSALGYSRGEFLPMQMVGVLFFGLTIPISAIVADRFGRERMLIAASLCIAAFGLFFESLFVAGSPLMVTVFLSLGLGLMGLTYGPLGAALAQLYPTAVRYTGASVAFTLSGILGASPAPYVATWLAGSYGIASVGWYLSAVAGLAALSFWIIGRRGIHAANAAGRLVA
jgi:metabolite-proton symporter